MGKGFYGLGSNSRGALLQDSANCTSAGRVIRPYTGSDVCGKERRGLAHVKPPHARVPARTNPEADLAPL
jgi:hypothetical protein